MKIKTSELKDEALNWAVEMCEKNAGHISINVYNGTLAIFKNDMLYCEEAWFCPSTNWAQGGPIIEREKIATVYRAGEYWLSYTFDGAEYEGIGPTPLIAAMRCYVASKLGDEVEVPDGVI